MSLRGGRQSFLFRFGSVARGKWTQEMIVTVGAIVGAEEDGIGGAAEEAKFMVGVSVQCCAVADGGEESGGHGWSAALDS